MPSPISEKLLPRTAMRQEPSCAGPRIGKVHPESRWSLIVIMLTPRGFFGSANQRKSTAVWGRASQTAVGGESELYQTDNICLRAVVFVSAKNQNLFAHPRAVAGSGFFQASSSMVKVHPGK